MMKSIILFIGMMVASSALCSGELKLTASAKVTGNKVQFKIVNHSKSITYLCDPEKYGYTLKLKREEGLAELSLDYRRGNQSHWQYLVVLLRPREEPESYGYAKFESEIKELKDKPASMTITLYVADVESIREEGIAALRRIELPVKLEYSK